VAGSSASSPSSPNAPLPSTTRADRMPPVRHALPPTPDTHRPGRDSDVVRAWRAGRRRARPATRKKHPGVSVLKGFETPPAWAIPAADHPSRSP
jgi:hypothetical protein